ncbi:MAG: tyrosine--tRNA ligase [Phycisphaeraceae bacterium]
MTTNTNLYDILAERGLVSQTTDENIRERLSKPVTCYIGFDPTADSLHVGSLVPIMVLAHAQRCGHKPIAVIGGGTGLVGDPSGKTESRKMLTREDIEHNAKCIAGQIASIVEFNDSPTGAIMVNNADWLTKLGWIELLRDYGPHFSVNRMLTMDSVRSRIESESGLTFLEFNYMVMQAIDFVHLYKQYNCTVQMGGQDQWGNIVIGIELGRRIAGADLAGLTMPLVTKSDGSKFGKSESGNIWLDPSRTSPYDFYQFWRNTPDADVKRYLGFFTFLPMEDVNRLGALEGQELNQAKEVLAYEVTRLIHGEAEATKARDSARKAFSEARDVTGEAIPHADLSSTELADGPTVVSLLVKAGLAKSNGEAKRLIQGGGVKVHDQPVTDITRQVGPGDIRDGYVLLRVGKKRLYRFDVK